MLLGTILELIKSTSGIKSLCANRREVGEHANKPLKHSQHYPGPPTEGAVTGNVEKLCCVQNPIYHLKSSIWAIHPVQSLNSVSVVPSSRSGCEKFNERICHFRATELDSRIQSNWLLPNTLLLLLHLRCPPPLPAVLVGCCANLQFACQRTRHRMGACVSLFTAAG